MLVLEPRHDRVLYASVSNSQVGLDRSLVAVDGLANNFRYFRNRSIQGKQIGFPDLPLIFNIDKYIQNTIVLQGAREDEIPNRVLDNIINSYINEVQDVDNHLVYLRLFAYDYKCLDNYFSENWETFESHTDDNITALFSKTMKDMQERDNLFDIPDIGARLYHSIEYNIIVEVVNYDDWMQASDYYLTLGLIPMLYHNIKEKLNDKEIIYFKELVRRSQVKRVRNVEITNNYYDVCSSDKYRDKIKDFRFKSELENLLRTRRRNYEVRLNDNIREKDRVLNRYQDLLRAIDECQLQLAQLEDDKTFREEIELVMNMKPMRDFQVNNNSIQLTVVTNLEYYDPEMLDITLSRNRDKYCNDMTNQFFRDVFIDEKYEYYVGQVYPFRLDEQNLTLPQQINYVLNTVDQRCLYNPHIQYYHCYGTNEPEIIKAHNDKDLVAFANTIISSLKNVNFADSAVFGRWYRSINALLQGDVYEDTDCRDYITTKFLRDKETGEFISLADYAELYNKNRRPEIEAQFVEDTEELEATELDVHIAGEEE